MNSLLRAAAFEILLQWDEFRALSDNQGSLMITDLLEEQTYECRPNLQSAYLCLREKIGEGGLLNYVRGIEAGCTRPVR